MTFEISIGIFIITIILSRVINEKATKELSEKKKIELIDEFSSMRIYNIVPIFLIIGGFYYAVENTKINSEQLFYAYYFSLILYVLISQTYVYKKLIKLDFPKTYVQKFVFSRIILFVGVAFLFYDLF